jgi:hypothetical protein
MGKGLPGGRRQAGNIDYRTEPCSSLPAPPPRGSTTAARARARARRGGGGGGGGGARRPRGGGAAGAAHRGHRLYLALQQHAAATRPIIHTAAPYT